MHSISVHELRKRIRDKDELIMIDVREPWEHAIYNIGGTLIPLHSIFENTALIKSEKPVVFYCQKGIRSQIAIQRLQQRFNYSNLINLTGGMDAWINMENSI